MSEVRVRIAPSPSGYLHIGTARAALFNWLFARHNQGKFLLRIEDTDQARSSEEMVRLIFDSLKWLGLEPDEKPIFQSERFDIYSQYAARLLAGGRAYRCWCEPEILKRKQAEALARKQPLRYDRTCYHLSDEEKKRNIESGKPAAIRLFVPEGETAFDDLILGQIKKSHADLDDFIVARSDNRPVYNLAVVVDDHEMGITHVIRGNDHVSNTFKQILLYQALDLPIPRFAHIPLILNKKKAKLSKRDGAAAVTDYARMGYLNEAVVNFIALLGWSPGEDREIMTLDEMVEAFGLDRINPANAVFDPEKLAWMNGEYIRRTDDYILADRLRPFLVESGLVTHLYINSRWDYILKFVRLLKERCRLLTEFVDLGFYFFTDQFSYDKKGVEKYFSLARVADYLKEWRDILGDLEPFETGRLETALRELADRLAVKPAELIHPTRLAISGLTGGPGLFGLMEALGKDKCILRLNRALEFMESRKKGPKNS
jgi:glutamyl-tRNA synthetase